MVSTLDEKMLSLNEAIQECLEKQEELNMSTKTKESNREDQRVLQGLDYLKAGVVIYIMKSKRKV